MSPDLMRDETESLGNEFNINYLMARNLRHKLSSQRKVAKYLN